MPQGIMRPGGLQLTEELLQMAVLDSGARILDLGCGQGTTVGKLQQLGYQSIGVDISPKLIAEACARYPEAQFMVADGTELPFDEAAFTAVICECSLSEMPVRPVLGECARLLKPGGKILISDIYARKGALDAVLETRVPAMLTKGQWVGLLAQSGFCNPIIIDKSDAFTEFVLHAIWEYGGLANLFDCCQWSRMKESKPGYFLMVATREEK